MRERDGQESKLKSTLATSEGVHSFTTCKQTDKQRSKTEKLSGWKAGCACGLANYCVLDARHAVSSALLVERMRLSGCWAVAGPDDQLSAAGASRGCCGGQGAKPSPPTANRHAPPSSEACPPTSCCRKARRRGMSSAGLYCFASRRTRLRWRYAATVHPVDGLA